MTDINDPTPPPPTPSVPAAEAARAAAQEEAAATTQPGYDPAADPDDTGVPQAAPDADLAATGRGFLRALFDVSFATFITRRLASAFYVVGLVAIGIAFIVYFVGGLVSGIGALWWNPGAGVSLLVATLIVVPIAAFLAVVVLRFVIEAVVALIAIAENTEQTAKNTARR